MTTGKGKALINEHGIKDKEFSSQLRSRRSRVPLMASREGNWKGNLNQQLQNLRPLRCANLLPKLKLLNNLLLGKPPRMAPQHVHALLVRHGDLLGADGDQTLGEGVVVLHQQTDGDEDVVDVVEDEGVLGGVVVACLEEGDGVIAPVAEGVEVV